MKLCRDCKYFNSRHTPTSLEPACTKHTYDEQDAVTGKVSKKGIEYARYERQPSDPKLVRYLQAFLSFDKKYLKQNCGPEAIYYEAK